MMGGSDVVGWGWGVLEDDFGGAEVVGDGWS